VSNAAKMFRSAGGFTTHSDEPIMIGQIQVLDIENPELAKSQILANKALLLAEADKTGGSIIKRGGGAKDIQARTFPNTSIGHMLVVHLLFDTREAMGAN